MTNITIGNTGNNFVNIDIALDEAHGVPNSWLEDCALSVEWHHDFEDLPAHVFKRRIIAILNAMRNDIDKAIERIEAEVQ